MEENEPTIPRITDDEIKRPDFRWIDIDDLKPYPKNPRKHSEEDIRLLMHSLSFYGWRQPINIAKGTNVIVAGHGRVEAARRLGLRRIPCSESEDVPQNHDGYRIMDNKSQEMSEWDFPVLREELVELESNGFNIGLAGFSDEYLKGIVDSSGGSGEIDPANLSKDLNQKCPRCGFEFEESDK